MKKCFLSILVILYGCSLYGQQSNLTDRTYGIAIIWIKDQAKWEEYGRKSNPIVEKYGGGIERTIEVQAYQGGDITSKPDIINVTYMDSPQSQQAMMQDPEFKKLMPLRQAAIDMIFVGGSLSDLKKIDDDNLNDRIYSVELAYVKDNEKYQKYMHNMQKQFGKHGFTVERSIIPQGAYGIETPSALNVMYYDNSAAVHKARHDENYKKYQEEIYPSVVDESIWFSGRIK